MNILEGYSSTEIDDRFTRLVKSERKITHLILSHIVEVERRKIFLDFGLTSVYQYLTQRHGYCESSAYLRISAAKVFAQNPDLQQKIEDGSIKLSQLAKVQKCIKQKLQEQKQRQKLQSQERAEQEKAEQEMKPVDELQVSHRQSNDSNNFNKENSLRDDAFLKDKPVDVRNLLEKIENKSGFQTEKLLAETLGLEPQTMQKIAPQSNNSVLLQFSVTAEDFAQLQKLQDYLSHAIPTREVGALLTRLVKKELKSIEGKETSEGTMGSEKTTQRLSADKKSRSFSRRKHIGLRMKRRLLRKAGYRCEHVEDSNSVRCGSRFQLQVDHIKPLAKGGLDEEENMHILCGVHNRSEAIRYGLWKVDTCGVRRRFERSS